MIGTIIGDMVGSPYEMNTKREASDINWHPLFHPTESRFTDDTVLTLATADTFMSLLTCPTAINFRDKYKEWGLKYPNKGYGKRFTAWLQTNPPVKNKSYANGCMMRCSPIGMMYYKNLNIALKVAKRSIEWTHNSPESLRGVSAIVTAICMAYQGKTKMQIKAYVEEQFGCFLENSYNLMRQTWNTKNIRCNITCPQALLCFLDSVDYESAIRLAVHSNGDCDTVAAIAGSIAEAYYGPKSIPRWMINEAEKRLPPEIISLINEFYSFLTVNNIKSPYAGFII